MNETQKSKKLQTCVKFTPIEYQKILKASTETGDSIPDILKKSFFDGPYGPPLINIEDARRIMVQLQKTGTNVNQIARHLNSGIREGFHKELGETAEELRLIRKYVSGVHGHR